MSDSPSTPSPAIERALRAAAIDTEQHVARAGWDQPPRLFALVRNSLLAQREPGMGEQLQDAPTNGYTAVEQEGLPQTSDMESMLARLAWPEDVAGAALAIERIVVPPEAERDLPADPDRATEVLAAHPARKDVRVLVAVNRPGEAICLLRQRAYDTDDAVARGRDLAPGLVHALAMTFSDADESQPGDTRGL
ncbi:MAG: PPA1309 family protein [Ornithinimicrobium sp.]